MLKMHIFPRAVDDSATEGGPCTRPLKIATFFAMGMRGILLMSSIALTVSAGCDRDSTPPASEQAQRQPAVSEQAQRGASPQAADRAPVQGSADEPAAVGSAADAPAKPPTPSPTEQVLALERSHSTSLGSPLEGRLEGGVPVPKEGPGFRHNPRKNPARRYGTVELVQALVRAAEAVEQEKPGGRLTINDLSNEQGGDIPGHASHRSGRDVDVLFYLLDAKGKPRPGHPIPIDPQGKGTDYNDLADPSDDVPVQLDVPRTWLFLQHLVMDPNAHVQRIFVVEHIRSMVLAHARKHDAPEQAIQRVADLTCQPRFPHDDHMHIRVFCSPQDIEAGCEDTRPVYPWHRRHLAEADVDIVMAGPRKGPRPNLTSHAEARAEAGPMHESVTAFLDRRKAWIKKPHPGRRYCR